MHASPVSLEHVFWARYVDTLVDSSWMVLFFGFPVFLAFGLGVRRQHFLLHPAGDRDPSLPGPGLGPWASCSHLLLVTIFPAHRTRDILLLLTILVVILLYLMFRFMRPERLVNPDAFSSALNYFASFSTPSSPYRLPSQWALEALWPSLKPGSYNQAGFHLLLLWSTASAFMVMASMISAKVYAPGFSKSQEGGPPGGQKRAGGSFGLDRPTAFRTRDPGPDRQGYQVSFFGITPNGPNCCCCSP